MDESDMRLPAEIDRETIGALYEQYHDPIYRYCRHRLFTPEAAEDVTSSVFLAMAEGVGRFRGAPRAELCRWLFAVASNKTSEFIRNTSRRERLLAAAAESGSLGSPPRASDNGHPSWPSVYRAIQRLKPHEQTMVTLRFFEGLDAEEIATILGRKPVAVRVALSRAVRKLRDRLAGVRPEA
jgi:RNA polymerase sigma-70 factor (ECF subfamily)